MLKNILKVAFRSLWRQKGFSIINIFGLSIGITACILIFLFIEYESSFDKYHKNAEDIYRVVQWEELPTGKEFNGATTYPLHKALKLNFTEYEATGFYLENNNDFKVGNEVFDIESILYVDTAFHKLFDINWIDGSSEVLHKSKNHIAISESLAKIWFENESPIGKTVKMKNEYDLVIVGLVADCPKNSSIPYNIIGCYDFIDSDYYGFRLDNWGMVSSGFETFIILPEGANTEDIASQITRFADKLRVKDGMEANRLNYELQSFTNIHHEKEYQDAPNTYSTTKTQLGIFAAVGLLILALACINFVNLATAQSIKKAKEVGIRKVSGAYKSQVFFLFISETIIITLIAVFFAFILAELALPYFNNIISRGNQLSMYSSVNFIPFILGVIVLILLMAGLYPGLVLSRFQPIKVLRAQINSSSAKISLRSVLVVLQFIVSIALVIATLTINKQVNFLKNKDLGFKTENILFYEIPEITKSNLQELKSRISQIPEIKDFSFGYTPPSTSNNFKSSYHIDGEIDGDKQTTVLKMVDTNYHNLFELEMITGRWFHEMHEGDSLFEFVVSEKIAKDNNLAADEMLGMPFSIAGAQGRIVGVVKDFHQYDLKQEIGTTAFIFLPGYFRTVQIETDLQDADKSIEKLNAIWSDVFPDYVSKYEFLDDNLHENYLQETNTFKVLRIFSLLGIFIAVLGLLGLVSYMVAQQAKVIGIRKVLGASISKIILWISRTYIRMMIIANIVAWPISYLILSKWLEQFAFRIEMPWLTFVLTGILSIVLAYAIIFFQTFNISRSNPVDVIRSE